MFQITLTDEEAKLLMFQLEEAEQQLTAIEKLLVLSYNSEDELKHRLYIEKLIQLTKVVEKQLPPNFYERRYIRG